METQFNELKQRLAEVSDLNAIMSILGWDQEVMMPRAGTAGRAEQRATLSRVIHEKFTSPAVGQLLEALRPYEESQSYDSDAASLIRVTRSDYDKECRIPADLRAEMTRSASQAYGAWVEARQKADFALFAPHLEQQLALKRRYIACFPPAANPYDVLLDDFERGLTTAEVSAVFAALKADLVPLIRAISARGDAVSADCLHGYFPTAQQQAFCLEMLEPLGFSAASWRLDPTVHPFSTGAGILDRRITTRYHEDYVGAALFGALHECGHGLYEFGVSPTLERTPLCRGASYAMHESQSRLWENLVGRSRTFWVGMYPKLQAAYPAQFGGVALDEFYRAINKVQPSLIRVEADEATYGLHIILRFELEQELIAGQVALRDLPALWNARMKEYLGVDVPDDAHGVLQDVHWSQGYVGYFPTYLLGNIISCQLWEKMTAALPDVEEQLARSEFAPLREWLRVNIYQHGRKFTPKELLQRVTGGGMDVRPYVRYLSNKFSEIYGL